MTHLERRIAELRGLIMEIDSTPEPERTRQYGTETPKLARAMLLCLQADQAYLDAAARGAFA